MPVKAVEFDQYVEWADIEGVHPVALSNHALDNVLVLGVLADAYDQVDKWGRKPVLRTSDIDKLKAALAGKVSDQVINAAVKGTDPAAIVASLIAVQTHVGSGGRA